MIDSTISSSSSVTPARRAQRAARRRCGDRADGARHCQLVMSLFGAFAAFLAVGAERNDVVRRRSAPGDAYLYSLPHGSFGTVAFFQYGPFQFVDAGRRA